MLGKDSGFLGKRIVSPLKYWFGIWKSRTSGGTGIQTFWVEAGQSGGDPEG
ncbi:MAG: hypothetical protein GXO89_17770 [Chlorobi bacterium]|nr:hypothetical protein [Chlorobiota bacterium]